MKKDKGEKMKIGKGIKVIMTIGCIWCGKQIREDEYTDHPRNCFYYQEYLRQIV